MLGELLRMADTDRTGYTGSGQGIGLGWEAPADDGYTAWGPLTDDGRHCFRTGSR